MPPSSSACPRLLREADRGGVDVSRRKIQVLPDAVANQIAAGEVVERPASVVKELVENALDAGATRIAIRVDKGGKRRIVVEDDGSGMVREDALVAFDRHATSKIVAASDLSSVQTFGFRGEALPSIGAVSRTVVETLGEGESVGTRVRMNSGKITGIDDVARRRGTTIEVENLFLNAPVRAKFLKAVGTETRAVSDSVIQLALANPDVHFTLHSGQKELFNLERTGELPVRVGQIWGAELAQTLIPLKGDVGGFTVHGLIQRPDAVRSQHRRAYLFINGRPFHDRHLLSAIQRGYRTTIPERTRPWVFLFLRAPDGSVDINVHPAKHEVRFEERERVEELMEAAVARALSTAASAATLDDEADQWDEGALAMSTPSAPAPVVRERPPSEPESQIAFFVTGDEPEASPAAATLEAIPVPQGPRKRPWQALATYILVETRDGLLIVDQHSAHERVMFEELMDAFDKGGQTGQRLLFPLTLRLTRAEFDLVTELRAVFESAGFEVEGFGGETVIVHAVPDPHPHFDAERCFREMIAELAAGSSDLVRSARNQHERIAKTFACKGSVKAGQQLSVSEMETLLDRLFATQLPHHDVHGRPTIVRLGSKELARRFER